LIFLEEVKRKRGRDGNSCQTSPDVIGITTAYKATWLCFFVFLFSVFNTKILINNSKAKNAP